MNILFIKHFFVGFMVSDIPRVSVFGPVRIRLLSPRNPVDLTVIHNMYKYITS